MIKVLVIEDEMVAAQALVQHVCRVPGFEVVGHVRTGADALHLLATTDVDLVILDMYLPDLHGLELLRRIRGSGDAVDVVVTTRSRDLDVVSAAVSFGVSHYLVKPFTFETVRRRLEQLQAYRAALSRSGSVVVQQDIDELLHRLRDTPTAGLPAGISSDSLGVVMAAMRRAGEESMSAVEVAEALGSSRVTARRYLEYLADAGLVARSPRYGGVGRPEIEYRLLPSGSQGDAAHGRT
jgi:response regulator of citrate/malate metabolism